MKRHLSARARLTVLYTSLFAMCGLILVTVSYELLATNLPKQSSTTIAINADSQQLIQQCVTNMTGKGAPGGDAKTRCAELYAKGVDAGVTSQRTSTLDHVLGYSLVALAIVTLVAALAGWFVAGRILRPVHQLTAAARDASERNLSHRLALTGPRDELRELADTFDAMLERLEDAFVQQKQFIANASHELRTPLTMMRTSIDVVLAKANPRPDELTTMAVEVRDAVDEAERLIGALLTLARTENQQSQQTERVDLATIAEDVLEDRPDVDLTVHASLNEAPVNGSPLLIERLIANLIDNATQYNRPGGSIAVTTDQDNGACVLRVVNTGAIVPPDQIPRLRLPFTRMHDRTTRDGFGLGLALATSIAQAHGGTIDITSIPTGGLDIVVTLPKQLTAGPID